jgi:diguanylate cyclase (GGDEF)-like protein/PAS domain S-box-containing protein
MFDAIKFLPTAPESSLLYTASYQPAWVVVSVLLAMLGAYAALGAASRASAAPDALTKRVWMAVSSLAFGVGTWAMHFIGMLALSLPCRLGYDLRLTLVSVLPAILGGFAVFGVVWRQDIKHLPVPIGSMVLGGGIGTMHYTGMAAMQLDGLVRYNPALFALSLAVAVVLSWFALRAKGVAKAGNKHSFRVALILGTAVSGMHYTAMAAAYFVSGDASDLEPSFLTPNSLAFLVSLTTAILALAALGFAALSRANAATHQLALSEAKLKAIIEAEPECIKIVDAQGRLLQMNPAGLAMIEADSLAQVAGLPVIDLIAPEYRATFNQLHQRVLAGETTELAFEVLGLKGGRRWLETHAVPMQDQGQTVQLAITRDISGRKHAEDELRIAATAFESQQGMLITDAQRLILRVNKAFTAITGYSADEAVGHYPSVLSSGRHDQVFYAAMTQSLEREGAWAGEIWNRRKSGEVYPEWLSISAVKDALGLTTHYVAIFSDISERDAVQAQLDTLAFYDPLTQLPNRRLMLDRLEQALHASTRHKRKNALLFVDLDNFKTLNDTRGHSQGDALLVQVAQRLKTCSREGDTVSHLGSDEFVVLLEDLSEDDIEAATQAETVANKILAGFVPEFSLGAGPYNGTASIGVTLFGAKDLESSEEPLKRAELAMFQSKAAGHNLLRFFDAGMQAEVSARAALEADLREAVYKQQLVLHYQPQVVGAGRITGVEALVRWQHPLRGMVSPAEFIPLAEESSLILPIGQWVLDTACAQLAAWAADPALAHLTMAVNVSARQFKQADFVLSVVASLARTGANPKLLKLELTESMLVDDVEAIIAKMGILKAHGVGFSLDDFGTGYSSLAYLKRLPLDQLKIDQGFVRNIVTDTNDAAIAKMVMALAESLGLSVIAEGVELQAQANLLAHLGCHAYQGYLFSRPLPLAAFESFLRQTQDQG